MATTPVTIVDGSWAYDEVGNGDSSSVRSFNYDLDAAPGVNRVLLVYGTCKRAADVPAEIEVPTSLTFGGEAMSLQTQLYPIASGTAGFSPFASFIGAIAVDDGAEGIVEVELTMGGTGDRAHAMRAVMIQDANQDDAALTTYFDSTMNSDSDAATLSVSIADAEAEDLLFGVGFMAAIASGFSNGWSVLTTDWSPPDPDYLTSGFYSAGNDLPFPSIDTRGWANVWVAIGLEGAQTPVLTANEFDPGTPYGESWGFAAFRIRAVGDEVNFNCECDDTNPSETLAEMRLRMMDRLGFAALRASPPPGMSQLLTTFLQDAQNFLYRRYPALRTRRFFRWTMLEGERYYGIRANDEDTECAFFLDPYKQIEGVWLVDLNGAWLPMGCGIPPTWYTTVAQEGIPNRYEIRQCLEVFPAPNVDGYQLYVKGHFGKRAFTADADKATIDGDLVYLWALANAKAHYGQPDANSVAAQANTMLKDLVAGTHLTKRYIPGTVVLPPAVMPVFLPLAGNPP